MREKILLVQESNLEILPPLLTVISVLQEKYDVVVLTGRRNPLKIEQLWDKERVSFICGTESSVTEGLSKNWIFKALKLRCRLFKEAFMLRRSIREYVKKEKISFFWVGSAETALLIRNFLPEKSYVACMYELLDENPGTRFFLKKFYQNATTVIVPEKNRAYITKFWLNLSTLPVVIANRPEISLIDSCGEKIKKGKIILYQGIFNPAERDLSPFCEAVEKLAPAFEMLLIGKENDYSKMLCAKYKNTRYGGYFVPPTHLEVTRSAYIGIATYTGNTLNTAYCAPNKIWEYGACGLPMLINDMPGLTTLLMKWDCSVIVDEQSIDSIKGAIEKIDANYSFYSNNARKFYASEDVKSKIINSIIGNQNVCLKKRIDFVEICFDFLFWIILTVFEKSIVRFRFYCNQINKRKHRKF